MKIFAFLVLSIAICPASTFARASAHSSPEDRQRFVTIVQRLEQAPLNRDLQNDREWALQWLTDAPDLSISVCLTPLEPLDAPSKQKYAYFNEILVQYMFEMGAYIIQNPEKQGDQVSQQLAGVEGALKAYRSITAAQLGDKSSALETLLEMQARGELHSFVQKAWHQCSAKGAEHSH